MLGAFVLFVYFRVVIARWNLSVVYEVCPSHYFLSSMITKNKLQSILNMELAKASKPIIGNISYISHEVQHKREEEKYSLKFRVT